MTHCEKISFVIPCYGSEKTLESVVKRITVLMGQSLNAYEYEIILVNDSSPDGVLSVIETLCTSDPEHIKGVDFVRNFGQHCALMAGYQETTGDFIVSLDDDGQTPPEATTQLLQRLQDGFDVVYASYDNKKHTVFRNLGSRLNDYMMVKLLNKPKDLYISSFFIARRIIIDEIKKYPNAFPYMQGLILRTTRRIANCSVKHSERLCGNSGYTLSKLIGLLLNGFTAFSVLPLRLATFCGGVCAMGGFAGVLIVCIRKLLGAPAPLGYSALMTVILFIGGMIMLMLGMIGEYVGRSYLCLNHAPQYVVRKKYNLD